MNWSVEVFVFIFSFIVISICVGLLLNLYIKKGAREYLPLLFQSIALQLYIGAGVVQYLFLSVLVFQIQGFFILITCAFSLISLDYISRFNLSPLKAFLLGIITCGLIKGNQKSDQT